MDSMRTNSKCVWFTYSIIIAHTICCGILADPYHVLYTIVAWPMLYTSMNAGAKRTGEIGDSSGYAIVTAHGLLLPI